MRNPLNIILKASIYILVFLLPLFFLPFTVDLFDMNKTYLLIFLAGVGVLAWLGDMVFRERSLRLVRTPLDIFVLLFPAAIVLSTVFSVDKMTSWMGAYGRFWPSLTGTLALTVFYFLITNNVKISKSDDDEKKIPLFSLLRVFSFSSLLVILVAYFSLMGFWAKLAMTVNLPSIMSVRIFNTLGGSLIDSFAALSLYVSFVLALVISKLSFRKADEPFSSKIVDDLLLIGGFGLLAIIDFWPAWASLAVALALLLIISFWKRLFRDDVLRLSLPVFLLIAALVFVIFNPLRSLLPNNSLVNSLGSVNNSISDVLNQKTSFSTSLGAIKESPLFGVGIGNFSYVYSKFKPDYILKTSNWQARFDRSGNHLSELLATTGLLGFLSYIVMLGMFVIVFYFFLSATRGKDKKEKTENVSDVNRTNPQVIGAIILFVAFVNLLVSQIFYYQNITLAFCFWLTLGLLAAMWAQKSKDKSFSFKSFPEVGLVCSVAFLVLLVGFAVALFVMERNYRADVYYREYLVNPQQNFTKLEKASQLASNQSVYHLALSSAYLQKLKEEAAKTSPDKQLALSLMDKAGKAIKMALRASPKQVVTQEAASLIYSNFIGLDKDALNLTVQSFNEAMRLEPKNPALLTELGKIRLFNGEKDEARNIFNKAIAMKSDYVDAVFQLALLDEEGGKIKEAEQRLESLAQQLPTATEVHFQLGRMYFNDKEYEKARQELLLGLRYSPNHSNSLYYLALIYEQLGDKETALQLLNRLTEINPGNKDLEDKINSLKGSQPKIEEKKADSESGSSPSAESEGGQP